MSIYRLDLLEMFLTGILALGLRPAEFQPVRLRVPLAGHTRPLLPDAAQIYDIAHAGTPDLATGA